MARNIELLTSRIKALDNLRNLEHKKILKILDDIDDLEIEMEDLISTLENNLSNEKFETTMDKILKTQRFTNEFYDRMGSF